MIKIVKRSLDSSASEGRKRLVFLNTVMNLMVSYKSENSTTGAKSPKVENWSKSGNDVRRQLGSYKLQQHNIVY